MKPGRASLIGGVAVAATSFVIWTAIAHQLGSANGPVLAAGVLVSACIGTWIRLADL